MARYDSYNSECLIFTFKEGLLSRIAHDLKLRVTRFSIDIDDQSRAITASFDPSSIEVVCAQVDGRDDPGTLSDGDKAKIQGNIQKDVLRTKKHPEIRFRSESVVAEGEGFRVEGALDLHGRTRALTAVVRPSGDEWVTEVPIHQPDFGIKPYSAALGTLKVKPEVKVRVSLPRE